MKKVLAIVLMTCIAACMNMGIAAADEIVYEGPLTEEIISYTAEYEYTDDTDTEMPQLQTEPETQVELETENISAEEIETQTDSEPASEILTETESEISAENNETEPVTTACEEEQEQSTSEEQRTVESETEEIHEETLNAQARTTITVTVSNKDIEDYYTKYGGEFFTSRMYDSYDEATGAYNLTYTVKLADGGTFVGNRDELYARFGSYPEYYRSRVVSSEMVIYEKFLGETYYIWLKVVPHNHTIVTDPKVAATETSTGLTEGSHCSVCGEVIVKQEVIPTLQKHIGWYNANGTWFFYNNDGTMATGWLYRGADNNGRAIWYYFNQTGAMITGWKSINGSWYYFNSSGRMAYGWQKINGNWYYMNSSGRMDTGWDKINGNWYYLNPGGSMAVGWKSINGSWYFFDSNGVMATGWLYRGQENGKDIWYYMGTGGSMTIGWAKIGGSWYYLNSSGRMDIGWTKINGNWYYLNSDGSMATGWKLINGSWYFFSSGGAMATGWLYRGQKDGNDIWYYMNESGAMTMGWLYRGTDDGNDIWYYFNSSGQMVTNWKTINGTQYYFKSSGRMAIGWADVTSGSYQGKYYFDSNGEMHVGFLTIGDKKYYFDNSSDDSIRGKLKTGKFTYLGVTYTTDEEGVIILIESEIVDIDSNAALGEKIVAYARQWVGVTPYVEAADRWTEEGYKNSLTDGTDCSGFTHLIYKTFGIDVPTGSDAYQTSVGTSITYTQLLPGDIIVYRNGGHVAIYAGNDTIIHCANPTAGTIIGNMWYSTPTKYIRVVF